MKASANQSPEQWRMDAQAAERNFVIQKNDLLTIVVSTNKGERIIDPNPELTNAMNTGQQPQPGNTTSYLVDQAGLIKLPMIGELKVEGLTLRQTEEMLQKEYATYFKEPFVQLAFTNKRVVILGAPGGRVVPLTNQSMTLAEVLALANGVPQNAKAHSIRIIRGEKVYQVDLSTIEGFQKGNMVMEPNDIVYVEPVIRPVSEALRDYSTVFTLIISLTTLIAVITNLR